jgi:hypothetical protein
MKKLLTVLLLATSLSASAQIITGNMEAWTNYNSGIFPPVPLEIPSGWHGSDSLVCFYGPLLDPVGSFVKQIFKSTDKHSGSFAAKLVTKTQGTVIGVLPAAISNATMTLDTSNAIPIKLHGGVAVTHRYDYANAWVKYIPAVSGEETQMYVEAVIAGAGANGDDSVIGTGTVPIYEDNNYSLISANIIYNQPGTTPNRIRVVFLSSASTPNDGSELYVDDVTVSLFPVQVERVFESTDPIKLYPTIGNGMITLQAETEKAMQLQVYNNAGQLMAEQSLKANDVVNLTHLSNGLYFYAISMDNHPMQRGKFIINK